MVPRGVSVRVAAILSQWGYCIYMYIVYKNMSNVCVDEIIAIHHCVAMVQCTLYMYMLACIMCVH